MAETNNVGKAAPSIEPSQGIPDSLQEVLFEGPIPGQSLTNPTDERKPWEQAPRYTQLNEVRQKIFMDLLEPERLRSLQTLLSNKDKAMISKQLVTLKNDVPLKNEATDFIIKDINKDKLYNFLRDMEFN